MIEVIKSLPSDPNEIHINKNQMFNNLFKVNNIWDTIKFFTLEVDDVEDILKLKPNGVMTLCDKPKGNTSNHLLDTIIKFEQR